MENKGKGNRQVARAFVMILQVGISMMTPMLMCGILGHYLDVWLDTEYWFLIFLVLGILSACRNVYLMLRKFYKKDLEKESGQLEYMKELHEYHKNHEPENIDDLKVRRPRNREKF